MPELFLNGRFVLQRTTGVQRVAREVAAALDRRLEAGQPTPPCTLLLPPAARTPAFSRLGIQTVPGPRHAHLWEQWALPRAARGGLLVNLAGAAPALSVGPQACLFHDAAVFDHPEAYAPAFAHWYRWLFRRHARIGSRLLTVSAFARQRLALALAVPEERFAIVPLSADHLTQVAPDMSVLTSNGLTDRPFLLAVGSANPTKRLVALVRAWAGLARHDARLVIAGGSRPQVFASSERPSVAGVVELGPVGDPELKALYGAAAGLVFPSVYEGFGLPPLEAMACGCPVAASSAASVPEVCGDAALMFDPMDESALAEAMSALLDDAALRDHLRERGAARAAAFRWDDSASTLLKALGSAG